MEPRLFSIDKQLHSIFSSVSFSQYLNPINIPKAYSIFVRGAKTPPFEYLPLKNADELLRILDTLKIVGEHPFAHLLTQKIEHTKLLIYALRDRSAETFDALSKAHAWLPTEELLALRFPRQASYPTRMNKTASQLQIYVQQALEQRGEGDWRVVLDSYMSARVLVQSAQKKISIQRDALFYAHDLPRLVIHEIDVHAQRSINGAQQPLKMFQTGLPHSIATEEGLAMIAEEKNNLLAKNTLADQTHLVWAIDQARHLGFRQLYERLKLRVGPRMSWIMCLRIKRGLSNPELPGVYAKDSMYLKGWNRVHKWLKNGGNIQHLYVGGVDVSHPIQQWLDNGWITLQKCPSFWQKNYAS